MPIPVIIRITITKSSVRFMRIFIASRTFQKRKIVVKHFTMGYNLIADFLRQTAEICNLFNNFRRNSHGKSK